jgi:gliding motility-associated-like protein
MFVRLLIYCLLSLPCFLFATSGYAQLGAPIVNQDFGVGNEDPNTIGMPLPAGSTDFKFSSSLCPPPGCYTVVRRMNVNGCFNGKWIPLDRDNTSAEVPGVYLGNSMLVNNDGSKSSRIVYTDTVRQKLCVGAMFELSAAIINLDQPYSCAPQPDFPYFALVAEADNGSLVAADTIKGVGFASPVVATPGDYAVYKFRDYSVDFIWPAGINFLVIKLVLLPAGFFNNCGADFAVDDIKLSAAGPRATIAFNNLPASQIVASCCFQDNKTFSMSGSLAPFYQNPALQWQQSIDKGITWTDIPGATTNTYTGTFSTPDTFLFRLSGAEAVNISNPECRVISNIITVNVDGIPANFKITSNSPVCAGQDLIFNAMGGASYTWSGPNGFYDNVYYAHIYHSVLADSGTYYTDIISLGGCVARDSIHVTVIGTDVFARPDTAVCKGRSVQLHSSPGAIGYIWSPATGLSSTLIANPVATPGTGTVYTVTVKDKDGCTGTASVKLTVLNSIAVKAVIEGAANLCRPYDSASFKDRSSGNISGWNWNFGNGQGSVLANPPVQYYSVGSNETGITVQLAVKDTSGCTDTAYHLLKVADNCYIDVPSAFTPNGDGINDYLYPLNAYKATGLTFRVYNRNGQLLFETRDWTKKWDGTVKGNPQPVGAYVWTLNYTDPSGRKIALKGTSVLLR